MAIDLTIAAVAQLPRIGSLRISRTANGRSTASFAIDSLDASYRPADQAEVVIEENATRIYGGLLDRPRERGLVDGSNAGIRTSVDVVDFNSYADRVHVNQVIPIGTVEDALTIIVADYLVGYGVTLDAGQVTGPTLPELSYTYTRVSEVLNQIATLTADVGEPYVWRIDDFKVLSMYQPSTTPAPFDLIGGTIPEVVGDIEVEVNRANYANQVIVRMPPTTEMNRTETFTGDGATTVFPLQYTPFANRGYVMTDFALNWMETLSAPGGGGVWELDTGTNSIERVTGAPSVGADIRFTFDGTMAAEGMSFDPGEVTAVGLWQKIITVESIPSTDTAQSLAEAYLARALNVTKVLRYKTREIGVAPGQSQTVTIPLRDLSGTAVITDVVMRDYVEGTENVLMREVTAVIDAGQTNLGRGFRDDYKVWYGDKTGANTAIGQTTVGPGAPPGPGSGVADSYVLKTTDETVNNSNTLQDDDQLACPVETSAVYEFEIALLLECDDNAADWRFAFSVPTGTTMLWGSVGEGGLLWSAGTSLTAAFGLLDETQTLTGGSSTALVAPSGRLLKGWIFSGGTAGTVQFRWAQNVATVVDNIVKAYSFFRYRRLI